MPIFGRGRPWKWGHQAAAVDVCIKNSEYYDLFEFFKLIENMRAEPAERDFVELLKRVGPGVDRRSNCPVTRFNVR